MNERAMYDWDMAAHRATGQLQFMSEHNYIPDHHKESIKKLLAEYERLYAEIHADKAE